MFCTPPALPEKHQHELAMRAIRVRRANAPDGVVEPQQLALLASKYWGKSQRVLTVSFMEPVTRGFANRIIEYANRWNCGLKFALTNGTGDIRISREGNGYWSFVGTDVPSIPRNRPTMNLQGFTLSTPESEWLRVVPHEFGHSMGFMHEHAREEIVRKIRRDAAYAYFRRTSGWGRSTVDSQVLTPLDPDSLFASRPDVTSIMAYHLPAEIMSDGVAVPGGRNITAIDHQLAVELYPLASTDDDDDDEPIEPIEPLPDGDEWDWANQVFTRPTIRGAD